MDNADGSAPVQVMIADRDPRHIAILADIVARFDPRAVVETTTSGLALVEMFARRLPSLAFVGVQLDDLSGPEAVATASKRGLAAACLVLVANRVVPQWQDIATSLGAYEVLKAPLDPQHIEALLHADVRRRKQARVLLACSSAASRQAISRVLGRSGFNLAIDETDCGRHALKQLRIGDYEFAFIDTKIEGIDGIEVACQVQALGLRTRITLLTTADPEPVAQAGRYFGVDAVLRMPFYARDIDLALHNSLGLRRPYLLNAVTAPPAPSALLRIADLAPAKQRA